MSKNQSLTAIVPFFNEGQELLKTVAILNTCTEITQIICVDDGSTNNTPHLLQNKFPRIALVKHKQNKGKTTAVSTALKKVTNSHALLFDADLSEINSEEINTNCKKTLQSGADCAIFKQENDPAFLKLLRFDTLFSGERIIKTQILKKILKKHSKEYALEFLINEYLLTHNLPTFAIPFHSKNKLKLQKWPILTSLNKTIQFQKLLFTPKYLKHLFFFHPQEL